MSKVLEQKLHTYIKESEYWISKAALGYEIRGIVAHSINMVKEVIDDIGIQAIRSKVYPDLMLLEEYHIQKEACGYTGNPNMPYLIEIDIHLHGTPANNLLNARPPLDLCGFECETINDNHYTTPV